LIGSIIAAMKKRNKILATLPPIWDSVAPPQSVICWRLMIIALIGCFERCHGIIAYGSSEEEVFNKVKSLALQDGVLGDWGEMGDPPYLATYFDGRAPKTLQEFVDLGNGCCRAFDDYAFTILKLPDVEMIKKNN